MRKRIDSVMKLLETRLHRNVLVNTIGVIWNGALIVLCTPVLVSLLGMEGYGLIGFWLMMQLVFSLFDLGLGASLLREFASLGHQQDNKDKLNLLLTLELVYWCLAIAIIVFIALSSEYLSVHWLKLVDISHDEAAAAVRWMALALGIQFPSALYSSGLVGMQLQGRVNIVQMAANTVKYLGGAAMLMWRSEPQFFFIVAAVASLIQTLAMRILLIRSVNAAIGSERSDPIIHFALLHKIWRFSAGMALTMIAGVVMANMDRLLLSRLLPAAELGKYTLAWTLTGFLQLGIQPYYRAFFPRFSELHSAGMFTQLRDEYFQGCVLTAMVIVPFFVMGMIFSPELFAVWLGRVDEDMIGIFRWLLVGVSGAALLWLPAAFQQAHGWTRLHASMLIGALLVGTPLMLWMITCFGTKGAATIWLVHGISGLTIGLWLMHRRLLVGELWKWYRCVLIYPLSLSLTLAILSRLIMPDGLARWSVLIWLGATCAILLIVSWRMIRGMR